MKAKFLEVNLSDFSSFSPLIIAENGSVGGIVFISLADFHQMRALKKSLIVQNEHGISTNLCCIQLFSVFRVTDFFEV